MSIVTWTRKLHCLIGLSAGLLFVLTALCGSLIAWLPELDRTLNPALLRTSSTPMHTLPMSPQAIQTAVDKLIADPAYGMPTQLHLPEKSTDVLLVSYARAVPAHHGFFAQPVVRQVMIDPVSLKINGEREWGKPGLSAPLIMPTLLHLHRSLLAGAFGKIVMAIVALLLLITSLSGVALCCSRAGKKLRKQAIATGTRRGSRSLSIQKQWHRIGGLVVAIPFTVIAFSGCYFNQPQWIISLVGAMTSLSEKPAASHRLCRTCPPAALANILHTAQQRYPDAWISRITLPSNSTHTFAVRLRQAHENPYGDGATHLLLDAETGHIVHLRDPIDETTGDRFLRWQYPLHSGTAFGTPGRIVISLIGMTPLWLLLSGWKIWANKRRRRT